MKKEQFIEQIKLADEQFYLEKKSNYELPKYSPSTHYLDVANSKYYKALIVFRDSIKQACDFYSRSQYPAA